MVGHQDWEEWVKKTSREESLLARGAEEEDEKTATSVAAKTLCIPFDQPDLPAGTKCIASGMPATVWVLWGRRRDADRRVDETSSTQWKDGEELRALVMNVVD
jgi:hypothetical protein